jgi:hypothetical protein
MQISRLTCASVGVGLLVAAIYYRFFFGHWGGFNDLSYYKEGYRWQFFKIRIWLAISAGSGVLAYFNLPGWFPSLFSQH